MPYLFAAPTGLIPCPTLSVVMGFAIIYRAFNSYAWSITLLVAGLFYGIFGIFKLHVWLDIGLLLGSIFFAIIVLKYIGKKSKS